MAWATASSDRGNEQFEAQVFASFAADICPSRACSGESRPERLGATQRCRRGYASVRQALANASWLGGSGPRGAIAEPKLRKRRAGAAELLYSRRESRFAEAPERPHAWQAAHRGNHFSCVCGGLIVAVRASVLAGAHFDAHDSSPTRRPSIALHGGPKAFLSGDRELPAVGHVSRP